MNETAIEVVIESAISAILKDALSELPSHVHTEIFNVARESNTTVSERPVLPGEEDEGFLPFTMNYNGAYYTSIQELEKIRDVSRLLSASNEIYKNCLKHYCNYVVGEALSYQLIPTDIQANPANLLKYASSSEQDKDIVKLLTNWKMFCEKNNMDARCQDWVKRVHRDGEVLLRIFDKPDIPIVRFVYPDFLEGNTDAEFGISYEPGDNETAISYRVRYPSESSASSIKASEIIHDKRNVDFESARGLPTCYAVISNLRRLDKLLVNVSVLAQIQSAIALIRKHENSSQAQVNRFLDKKTTKSAPDLITGNSYRKQTMRAGTILDAPKGTSYDFPAHSVDVKNFVAVIDKELAHVAAAFVQPVSWLLCEEAPEPINPGSPTIANILSERLLLYTHLETLFWKVQEMMGVKKINKLRERLKLVIEGPDIPVAKAVDQARIDEIYIRNGATCPQEVAARKGWNYYSNRVNTIRHRLTKMPGEQMPGDAGNTDTSGDGVTKTDGGVKSLGSTGGNTKV
jgi:hypothetical protein